jgi:Holliday junction resolvasome RuvABC ATP-dependent DNA helicase subunit
VQVPTIDTVRNSYVGSALVRHFAHTLVVGNVGVGKTMIIQVDVCVCVFATVCLCNGFAHTLVVGNVGVGKTMIIQVDVCVCSQLCVFATSLHTRWWWAMWE